MNKTKGCLIANFATVPAEEPVFGLGIIEELRRHGYEMSAGTVYPMLHGLEKKGGSVAKIVKLEHAWRRLDGRNDDGFQVAPFPG
ncbi:PadR family transcriptional regulator [Escherichia sp. WS2690]|uniref:PadR family transcriptional regulator n=1 Tax=Escherichia sp. WS2690 TaxID=3381968 RepID=UPI00396F515F